MSTHAAVIARERARRAIARRVRRRRAALAALVVAASLSLAPRVGTAEAALDERRLHELLDWIEGAAERDVDGVRGTLPSIVLAAPGETIRLGEQSLVVAPEMGGVWDSETRLIVLVEPWRASDPVDLSTLLHELVHAVQADAGEGVCDPEAEWEAYALQAMWLAERDIVMLVDWHEVWEHALCEEEPGS